MFGAHYDSTKTIFLRKRRHNLTQNR